MDELQDAIEDAQYVNAIVTQEDGPRPVIAWNEPSEEVLQQWKEDVRQRYKNRAFTYQWTLAQPIGYYLFSAFVKRHEYTRMNFCEDVLRFRKLQKADLIERLFRYLEPLAPPESEIIELDMARKASTTAMDNGDALGEMMETCYEYTDANACCIGLKGPVLDELNAKKEEFQQKRTSMRRGSSTTEFSSSFDPKTSTREDKRTSTSDHIEEDATTDMNNQNGLDSCNDTNQDTVDTLPHVSKIESLRTLRTNLQSHKYLPSDTFDNAESIVIASLVQKYWDEFLESPEYKRILKFLWYQDRPVVPEDFFLMRVLGRGGFGLVNACKKGTSGKLYAMKVMNKRRIKMKKSESLAINERKVLAAVESKFVVNLKYSFHSKDDVFLILDLMTGGDLGYHLHQKGRFTKKECLYYSSRIMLGLQALHDQKYVYRDLKPENLLLDEEGRVKITDMGLATRITPSLHGAAGTRGYWAPEMLRRDESGKRMTYGHAVDWFSFGCCVAEFISGVNPFRSEAALNFGLERGKQTKEQSIDCATMEMEPDLSDTIFEPEAADLCRRLLEKDETKRIGANGCEEIMAHPWFRTINWESIITDRKRPPFVPAKDVNAHSQSEIGNFAEDKHYSETFVTSDDDRHYKNWDWTNPRAYSAEVIEYLIYEREIGHPLVPIGHGGDCCCAIL